MPTDLQTTIAKAIDPSAWTVTGAAKGMVERGRMSVQSALYLGRKSDRRQKAQRAAQRVIIALRLSGAMKELPNGD